MGARKESPQDCARPTAAFLNLLAECDPFLAHWYKPPKSCKNGRKHSLRPPDVPTLAEFFRRGINRERGGSAIKQLGSGANPNSCVMPLPRKGPNADRIITAPVLASVVRSMASAWDADWALATSWDHRELLSEEGRTGTFVGWVTSLSRRRGRVPPLPAPVRIEQVEDKGRRVGELLSRVGLMQPVIP